MTALLMTTPASVTPLFVKPPSMAACSAAMASALHWSATAAVSGEKAGLVASGTEGNVQGDVPLSAQRIFWDLVQEVARSFAGTAADTVAHAVSLLPTALH